MKFVEILESPWLDRNPVCFTHRNSLSFCVLNCVYQRERGLKPVRATTVWVCRCETAWESEYCRNAKRSPFVCILVWVYFEHERFESGFRDLTLCVKVLRGSGACVLPPQEIQSDWWLQAFWVKRILYNSFQTGAVRCGHTGMSAGGTFGFFG